MSARPFGRWGALDSDHPARLTDDEIDRIDRDARSGADAVAIVAKVAAEKAYARGATERDELKAQVDALTREVERMRRIVEAAQRIEAAISRWHEVDDEQLSALDEADIVVDCDASLDALRRALRGEP